MNFSLRVVGFPGFQVQFTRIDPATAAEDCIAYVIANMRRYAQSKTNPHEHTELFKLVNNLVSTNAVLFTDDGTYREIVMGDTKSQAMITVEAATAAASRSVSHIGGPYAGSNNGGGGGILKSATATPAASQIDPTGSPPSFALGDGSGGGSGDQSTPADASSTAAGATPLTQENLLHRQTSSHLSAQNSYVAGGPSRAPVLAGSDVDTTLIARPKRTVLEAFSILDDGRVDGQRGWLYFAKGRQTVKLVTKLNMPSQGVRRPRMLNVAATDLIYSTVGDLKMMIADRLGLRVSEMQIAAAHASNSEAAEGTIGYKNERSVNGAASVVLSGSGGDGDVDDELANDESLFPYLRASSEAVFCVVRREGYVVEVQTTTGGVVSMSRFPPTATITDVAKRMRNTFGIVCDGLAPFPADGSGGWYHPTLQLLDITGDGASVKLEAMNDRRDGVLGGRSVSTTTSNAAMTMMTTAHDHEQSQLAHSHRQATVSRGPQTPSVSAPATHPGYQQQPPPPLTMVSSSAHRFTPSDSFLQHSAAALSVPGASYDGQMASSASGGSVLAGVSSPPRRSHGAVMGGSGAPALYQTQTAVIVTIKPTTAASVDHPPAPAPVHLKLPIDTHFAVTDLVAKLRNDGHLPIPEQFCPPVGVFHGRRQLAPETILQRLVPDSSAASATVLLTCTQ